MQLKCLEKHNGKNIPTCLHHSAMPAQSPITSLSLPLQKENAITTMARARDFRTEQISHVQGKIELTKQNKQDAQAHQAKFAPTASPASVRLKASSSAAIGLLMCTYSGSCRTEAARTARQHHPFQPTRFVHPLGVPTSCPMTRLKPWSSRETNAARSTITPSTAQRRQLVQLDRGARKQHLQAPLEHKEHIALMTSAPRIQPPRSTTELPLARRRPHRRDNKRSVAPTPGVCLLTLCWCCVCNGTNRKPVLRLVPHSAP